LVRRPDGELLDARWAVDGRARLHGGDQRPITAGEVWALVGRGEYAEPDLVLARPFAATIVALCFKPTAWLDGGASVR
jgi:hypothetical protein